MKKYYIVVNTKNHKDRKPIRMQLGGILSALGDQISVEDLLSYINSNRDQSKTENQDMSSVIPPADINSKQGYNWQMGVGNALNSLSELKNEDGTLDSTDLLQTGLDGISGASKYGQLGKQAGTIANSIIGQNDTTNTLGEGIDYQKAGITAMNKGLEYAAAGAQYGGPIGAGIGAVVGGGLGLIQANKRKKQALEEFMKRRGERINNFNTQSEFQYANQYLNQALYSENGGTINIKKENRGKFTQYCIAKGFESVTKECISEGKSSKNKLTKKRAVFADNARKFKK